MARWTATGVAAVSALLVAVATPAAAAPGRAPRAEAGSTVTSPGPAAVPGQLFPRDGLFVRAGAPVYPASPDGPGCVVFVFPCRDDGTRLPGDPRPVFTSGRIGEPVTIECGLGAYVKIHRKSDGRSGWTPGVNVQRVGALLLVRCGLLDL
jgi:hypothetical protein